ncbi:MAG TPA: DUF4124 domain-containing protein [Usitatibacter sp.]|nr:DUF4124 domain-containing protein [Usitatibacter sp.]
MGLRLAVAAFVMLIAGPAWADLFKCVGKDGRVTYQAEPCADVSQEQRLKAPMAEAAEAGPDGVSLISVSQAARRISSRVGKPTVVLLYATTCPLTRRMFPEFVALANRYRTRGVEFVVLSTDDERDFPHVAEFLAERKAPFEAVAIKPWAPGNLTRAMAPLGIEVGSTWTRPLLAVRDRSGRVVRQADAAVDLSWLGAALDSAATIR